ncbi:putative Ran-binding protein 1 [Gregarina niphandrodes]|uniref:Ran-binding protein 1 n=1 Tax=Gregarina niphandrodes TaxID=110365 RepID=A0A023BAX5_GRENI|nr:putative Ran-binding protein 1 [Gregarina niphandrodes]EZG78792.1 putative Ran-binding protein 1 [Gregarina niphandrodes]|eukprot:XP_011129195.1 putative Ran-binding protein 1 [Gregarina niphandrodes]
MAVEEVTTKPDNKEAAEKPVVEKPVAEEKKPAAEPSPAQELAATNEPTANEDAGGEEEVTKGDWNLPEVKLKEVQVVTGEEDEEEFWKCRAKLYRWRDAEWKERGLGDAKLLKDKEGKVRFLLRQEKTGKVAANHYVIPKDGNCTLTPNAGSDKIWVWSVLDCAEEEPVAERFGLRFGTVENAALFKQKFEEAGNLNVKLMDDGAFGKN